MFKKVVRIVVILDLVGVNLVLGYLVYGSWGEKKLLPTSQVTNNQLTQYVDRCGSECLAAVAARVEELESRRAGVVVTAVPTKKVLAKSKVRKEEILTIPGSGSTRMTDWTDISGTEFYFDTRDYPGLIEVYFEASMNLVSGGGRAYVRLYDVTHGISPVGGQNDTQSVTSVWTKSQKVYFWAGKNLMRIQAKSQLPDTAVFGQGRLRIITEN